MYKEKDKSIHLYIYIYLCMDSNFLEHWNGDNSIEETASAVPFINGYKSKKIYKRVSSNAQKNHNDDHFGPNPKLRLTILNLWYQARALLLGEKKKEDNYIMKTEYYYAIIYDRTIIIIHT